MSSICTGCKNAAQSESLNSIDIIPRPVESSHRHDARCSRGQGYPPFDPSDETMSHYPIGTWPCTCRGIEIYHQARNSVRQDFAQFWHTPVTNPSKYTSATSNYSGKKKLKHNDLTLIASGAGGPAPSHDSLRFAVAVHP